MSEKSVFTRIIEGELPSYRVYEDDLVVAFLDINPHTLGHTLVVPREQIDRFEDLPHVTAANLMIASQKIAKALKAATDCERVGVVIAGFDVPHTHLHLIPMHDYRDLDQSRAHKEDDAAMREMMERIVANLGA